MKWDLETPLRWIRTKQLDVEALRSWLFEARDEVKAIEAENKALRKNDAARFRQLDELRHAVGHALTCDQGTALCRDCKRLLTTAMEIGR